MPKRRDDYIPSFPPPVGGRTVFRSNDKKHLNGAVISFRNGLTYIFVFVLFAPIISSSFRPYTRVRISRNGRKKRTWALLSRIIFSTPAEYNRARRLFTRSTGRQKNRKRAHFSTEEIASVPARPANYPPRYRNSIIAFPVRARRFI